MESRPGNFCSECNYCQYCRLCTLCTAVCDSDSVVGSGVAAIAKLFGGEVPDVPSEFDEERIKAKLDKEKKEL